MAVDLHTHSTFSDGSHSPEEIVAEAARLGLSAVALTDHDSLEGISRARAAADEHGIRLISGIELSCVWPHGGLHLLAYHLEVGPGPLQNRLGEIVDGRADRNARIAARLQELGIDITLDEVVEEASGFGAGRPHFARVLVRKGVVDDIGEAFDRFLAAGRQAHVERFRLAPESAIALARASQAVPVVAHPLTLGQEPREMIASLQRLASGGLMGLECYYGEYEPEVRDRLVEIARSLGLVATGGSDHHGLYKPDAALGVGRGDLSVPDEALAGLDEAHLDLSHAARAGR